MSEQSQPKDPFEFFESPWWKDMNKQLCSDGWPAVVVPLNCMVRDAKAAFESQAQELASLRAENEFLQADGIHTCSNQCRRALCVLRRERDELKAAIKGLEIELRAARAETSGARSNVASLESIRDILLNDVDELKAKLEAAEKEIAELKVKFTEEYEWHQRTQHELTQKRDSLDRRNQEATRMHDRCAELKAEVERVKSALALEFEVHKQERENSKALRELVNRYRTALEFYADEMNWLYNQIKKADCEVIRKPNAPEFESGGKTARQALADALKIEASTHARMADQCAAEKLTLQSEVERLHQKTYDIDDLYKSALSKCDRYRTALEKLEKTFTLLLEKSDHNKIVLLPSGIGELASGVRTALADAPETGPSKDGLLSEEEIREIILNWKHIWMNQTQNSEADYQNYFHRAFGVDANMQYSLAKMIRKALEAAKGTV